MKKYIFTCLLIAAASVLLISWGSTGHYKISYDASLSFSPQMTEFSAWTQYLADHASDPDYRKDTDPDESPKHYIDIDAYQEFNATGRIPQTLDSVIALHGQYFVYDNGILPWATKTTYDSILSCFLRGDWPRAEFFASDLGHYVGDGFQPLHITSNYNGSMTGNNGIHSRYETTMINAYISQIVYQGSSLSVIPDVNQYIFDYLYTNYTYVDSIMAADNYARAVSSNTSSTSYKQALWSKCRYFTTLLFQNASHTLAEMIYTAWVNAGSPPFPASSLGENQAMNLEVLEQNHPNPFTGNTRIRYTLYTSAEVLLEVKDDSGRTVTVLDQGTKAPGSYPAEWNSAGFADGVYYLVLHAGNRQQVKRMVRCH